MRIQEAMRECVHTAMHVLQIYDGWNTSVPSYVFGGQQEMPVFQSKSYFLTVVFKTGGTKYGDVEEDNIGFSAIYTYVSCKYCKTARLLSSVL